MEVIKRNGKHETVDFNKISERISAICTKLKINKRIDPMVVAQDTIRGIYNQIHTEELDTFAAVKCAEKIVDDPEYSKLAGGIRISNLHKTTPYDFLEVTKKLHRNKDNQGKYNPMVTEKYRSFVKKNIEKIREAIDYDRDYLYDYFGIMTLERAYLKRIKTGVKADIKENTDTEEDDTKIKAPNGKIVERPQHMIMRVALSIHLNAIEDALETYDLMSQRLFTHATPTLFNAGAPIQQLSSCFLVDTKDSLEGIYDMLRDTAFISKWSGGLGVNLSNIRSEGSIIRGTNGRSKGIIPLIKVLNEQFKFVNQGGKRKGSCAVYLEPWHADIYDFCEIQKNTGDPKKRAYSMFLALWVNDLFMTRMTEGGDWSLMCPDDCPGLTTTYGKEFETLYLKYEAAGQYKRQVKAADLWHHILTCQFETGMPYMLYKDSINEKSNQKNVGVIQCSNLCAEITQFTSADEIAVCNLASICLPRFVTTNRQGVKSFDYKKLLKVSKVVTKNLNKVIDINYYPVKRAKVSNQRHRPIGIGVQGLSDVYCEFDLPYDSDEAKEINKKIFETIYFGACEASMELAMKDGPYETYAGSPFSEGKLQWHLWGLTQKDMLMPWKWGKLIENIKKHGMRNSLLTAIMPTASTSQIMGNTEACEVVTSNLYKRETLAGDFVVCRASLINKLIARGLWTQEIKEELIFDNGSIQKIDEIPDDIKKVYLTAYEMSNKPMLQQAIDRGPFIDQSQSQNIYSNQPDYSKMTKTHYWSWKQGAKAGMYYLRSQPAYDATKFGLSHAAIKRIKEKRNIVDEVVPETPVVATSTSTSTTPTDSQLRQRSRFADCDSCGA